ncbi:MAG: M23 family metallopeptidase [Firmicutes bacterium]|nr:M23 family metallopeptidase [Bacillota bacterium]MCL1953621.1 M23 family metallopeptidase [Bacillota bacterium]
MAIEGGTIQELGWNRFGGWRIGIRSHDTKRYYYYAHLRNKNPYPKELKKGDTVTAGQLIGFLGNTGYGKEGSTIKNAKPHLHLGLQIIFDPSQEKGPKEIWVDVYQLVRLLYNYRAIVD